LTFPAKGKRGYAVIWPHTPDSFHSGILAFDFCYLGKFPLTFAGQLVRMALLVGLLLLSSRLLQTRIDGAADEQQLSWEHRPGEFLFCCE